jgi:O-acetyl-ADP-ribose deacetylase (regulator of RNase III)
MKYIKGDLLESRELDAIYHCANVEVTFGGGIAYSIKKKYPEAYQADVEYDNHYINRDDKLGTFSKAMVEDCLWIYNLYGQVGVGNDGTVLGRNCHYNHLYNAMYLACVDMCKFMCDDEHKLEIGLPRLGCGRAGGSWTIVSAILSELESIFPINFTVYDFGDEKFTHPTLPL